MADFDSILEEFDALTATRSEYRESERVKMANRPPDTPLFKIDKSEEMTSLLRDAMPTDSFCGVPGDSSCGVPPDSFCGVPPDSFCGVPPAPVVATPRQDVQLMDLGFDEGFEALTLNHAVANQEQPWNIVQWLLQASDSVQETKPQTDSSMFLPPLPRTNKSSSERSYCSGKSSVTSYCSEKSALSSVTLDSESDATNTRLRSKRRARKPARYHAYPELDGESDSTLAGEVAERNKALAKVPRYKRPSHINAEHRRRFKIKTGFGGLDELLPPSNIPGKDSQLAMLSRAKDYIRQLHEERSNQHQELEELHQAVHNLNVEISSSQAMLPEDGMDDSTTTTEQSVPMEELFEQYVRTQTEDNWKFWIFSYFIRPLYYSYKKAVSWDASTLSELAQRVKDWVSRDMALSLLRPGSLKALCSFSKTSSVMTNPNLLPDEAKQALTKPWVYYRPADSGYSSTS